MYRLMIEWLRLKLNVPDLQSKCESCDALRLENASLRNEVNRLLDYILEPKVELKESVNTSELKPILPRRSNWQSERMRLERLDVIKNNELLKEKALKAAGQPNARGVAESSETATTIKAPSNIVGTNKSIEELEKDFTVDLPILVNDDEKVVGEN